ncbi:Secreted RxLR effector peptide protein [Phytophthora palmivora]|uniref:Secreted RxLR effector peptide protein n=1 Tax=Phytophthora palmivora TaxID=4796 RepID=A0A2P4YPN4_9STRA|nr:Secreted RxLR effector peptide protein [Phytophthora palmivora]
MRLDYVLLTTMAFLFATSNCQSADADAGMRHLRSIDKTGTQDEERANLFEYNFFDKLAHKLPQQFEDMRTKPAYLNYIFESWRQGRTNYNEAITYMEKQGVGDEAISHFMAAYDAYLQKHPFNAPPRPEV